MSFGRRRRFSSPKTATGHAMRQAVRADAVCERCGAGVHWNQKRSARDPRTGALQVVCRLCAHPAQK